MGLLEKALGLSVSGGGLGYLVGTLDRFNNAKRAEEGDRVKHMHV